MEEHHVRQLVSRQQDGSGQHLLVLDVAGELGVEALLNVPERMHGLRILKRLDEPPSGESVVLLEGLRNGPAVLEERLSAVVDFDGPDGSAAAAVALHDGHLSGRDDG